MKLLNILLLCFLSISMADSKLEVTISKGTLKGFTLKSRNGREYLAFRGIRYAKPPIGKLRFSNPVEVKSWSGVQDAIFFGNICPRYSNSKIEGNEDCLFLNVYCPKEKKTDELLPVMVWIHGGDFLRGSSSDFSAHYFMDKNVILVTLNYRLGIFGSFTTGDASAPGNFGLKDQVLALKWVQKNIQKFGGNPNKVTLFGQSSGGACVSLHAISKASKGLFQQYIIQSGSSVSPMAYQNNKKFTGLLAKFSENTHCPSNSTEALVTCLRGISTKDLIINTNSFFINVSNSAFIFPWIATNEPEVEDAFLTDSPQNLLIKNGMADLPFISGIVSDEALAITNIDITESSLSEGRKEMKDIINYIASYTLDFGNSTQQFYTAINKFHFKNKFDTSGLDEFKKSVMDMVTFGGFIYPELRMLECGTKKMKNSNYLYSFGYGKSAESNGVPHGAELPYLFPKDSEDINSNISQIMVDLWTSFAINGKPTSDKLTPPDLWKPYKAGNRVHLQIGNIDNYQDPKITLSNSFYPEEMKFWQGLYSSLQFPTCVKNRNTGLKPFTIPSLYVIIVVVLYYIMK